MICIPAREPRASEKPPAEETLMDHHDRMRLRAAAFRALKVYPGPVGQLLSAELLAWEDFGYRLGAKSLVMSIVADVMARPVPDPTPAAAQAVA
jgi:hypothetical protein